MQAVTPCPQLTNTSTWRAGFSTPTIANSRLPLETDHASTRRDQGQSRVDRRKH